MCVANHFLLRLSGPRDRVDHQRVILVVITPKYRGMPSGPLTRRNRGKIASTKTERKRASGTKRNRAKSNQRKLNKTCKNYVLLGGYNSNSTTQQPTLIPTLFLSTAVSHDLQLALRMPEENENLQSKALHIRGPEGNALGWSPLSRGPGSRKNKTVPHVCGPLVHCGRLPK